MSYRLGGVIGGIVTGVVALAILGLNTVVVQAAEGQPEVRVWNTRDGKHSVEALLVEHSLADVTLKLKNGKNKTIKLSLISEADVRYLAGFPSLKGEADAKNLPWVRVEAKKKASKRTGTSNSLLEHRSKTMEVSVANRSKQKLELTILYGFLVEDLTRKSDQRQTRTADLSLAGVEVKRITLEGQKDTRFVTEEMRTTEVNGTRKAGSKDQSFIVQAYWKGQLLHGWAADSNLDEMAKDGGLLERVGG